ncbi:MAG TPA: 4Fe-4S ferredoxin, partial [Gammaproteobacteria bacterium]|nr:4Fe-4S ferredoxin [Gammaproteobacteria bacterium]
MAAIGTLDAAWIERTVRQFWQTAPSAAPPEVGERLWEEPKLGFARGDDPLFACLKEQIGDFFWTPEEAFARAFPAAALPGSDLSVICYVLPQTAATREDQARHTAYPAGRWARS